ncbi:hypothetical protein D3C85_1286030 [compost metagenome]
MHPVQLAAVVFQMAVGVQLTRLLPGKVQRRNDDAAEHGGSQVGEHRDHRHSDDHQRVVQRHFIDHAQRGPGERLLRHHEHHTHQRRQRNTFDQRRQKQDEQQNRDTGHYAGQAPAPTGTEVDHGLADHRATAHAAEYAGDHVRRSQCHTLAIRIAAALGDFVGEVQGQQGFQQADQGHQDCVRRNDAQGFQTPRNVR